MDEAEAKREIDDMSVGQMAATTNPPTGEKTNGRYF